MAASIPVLRVLVHEVGKTMAERYGLRSQSRATRPAGATADGRTGGGSNAAGTMAKADNTADSTVDSSSVYPGPHVTVSSGNVHSQYDAEKSSLGDSVSEGNSGNGGANASLRILRTNEVALEYSERRAGKREGRPGRRGDGESWLE